jgi:hypothetical protein
MRIDADAVRDKFPSVDMTIEDWSEFFSSPAGDGAVGKIFYGIFNEVVSLEEKRAGVRRQGRRPVRPSVPLSEVMRRVFPEQWSMEPLGTSLPLLIGESDYAFREFAEKAYISRSHLINIIAGRKTADRQMLERFAHLGGRQPWYFLEWRAMFFSDLIREVFLQCPNLSIEAVKDFRRRGRLDAPHPLTVADRRNASGQEAKQ